MVQTQAYKKEVAQLIHASLRSTMPEPKILEFEACFDLANEDHTWAWEFGTVASGLQNNLWSNKGYVVCKKSEATGLVIVGQKNENCIWMAGLKKYWVKSK